MKKLDFTQSLRDSCTICCENAGVIVATVVLWLLTIWIPGVNIGTTIAILLLPVRLAEGLPIHPLSIFRVENRSHMSDCFLMAGMMAVPIVLALMFVFFPGVVLLLAWSLSFNYLIMRGKGPVEAIRASNRATCGSKWTMLFVLLVMSCIPIIAGLLCILFCKDASEASALSIAVITALLYILATTVGLSTAASFWKQLKDNVE